MHLSKSNSSTHFPAPALSINSISEGRSVELSKIREGSYNLVNSKLFKVLVFTRLPNT